MAEQAQAAKSLVGYWKLLAKINYSPQALFDGQRPMRNTQMFEAVSILI